MTYVVTENCIRCKYMGCIEICPVDRFYAGENKLVITPASALIAACENRSARPRRSSSIAMTAGRLGPIPTRPIPGNGENYRQGRIDRQGFRKNGSRKTGESC